MDRLSADLVAAAFETWPDAAALLAAPADPALPLRITSVNAAFERLYRTNRAECTGRSTLEFWSSRATRADQALTEARIREGKPFRTTRQMEFADGTSVWLEVSFSPVEPGTTEHWMFIARDITATHILNQRMLQLTSAVDQATDLIATFVWNGQGWVFDYINDSFTKTLGHDRAWLLGLNSDQLLAGDNDMRALARNRALLREGQTVRDAMVMLRKDGTRIEMEYTARPILNHQTEEYASTVVVFRDVTESARRQRELLHQAHHDALTGLFNRKYCEERLDTCIASARHNGAEHALLFVDLDGFKGINDRLGHDVGDDALRFAAQVFKECVLGSDVVARWGGDEFAILLYHCSLTNAQLVAQRMITEISHHNREWGLGASIGVINISTGASTAEAVRRADAACYAAKTAGGNLVKCGSLNDG